MVQKNQDFEVEIIDNGMDGEGIAKIDGYTTFVKGALKGEKAKIKIVKANKDYGFGKLLEVIENSKERDIPVCPSFGNCGGCSLQHFKYEAQLELKENIVKQTLRKALGKDFAIEKIIGMGNPYHYRNKAQYPVSNGKIGFYRERSHDLVENEKCFIQDETADFLAKRAFALLKEHKNSCYDEKKNKGNIRHIMVRVGKNTGELMLVIITAEEKIKGIEKIVRLLTTEFPNLVSIIQNKNDKDTNVIMGAECITLYGEDYIVDRLGEYNFKISPLSFYQVNPVQTEILYNVAKDFANLTPEDVVFDLYSGIGTISIFVADSVKQVYGVEIIEDAVEDAKMNAKINEISNVKFYAGAAEVLIPEMYRKGLKANVVFVDPPRKGCDKALLDTIIAMEPERMVYISCNPATLGRDLQYLLSNGFELKKVQPVDLFPMTRKRGNSSMYKSKNYIKMIVIGVRASKLCVEHDLFFKCFIYILSTLLYENGIMKL